jgi:hypothetical protein
MAKSLQVTEGSLIVTSAGYRIIRPSPPAAAGLIEGNVVSLGGRPGDCILVQ